MGLRKEIDKAIGSFDRDPPDSDHQRGYLAALKEMQKIGSPELKRFQDGTLKPFLSKAKYDELRDDDKFLYNRSRTE